MGNEGTRQYENEQLRDFEQNWASVDCFEAPEVIADIVFGTCARDMESIHPTEYRESVGSPQEDVVVRALFLDTQSILLTRRFTKDERVKLKVLEQLGVSKTRRKFPRMEADVLSLTNHRNWMEFISVLDGDEREYVAELLEFWGRAVEVKPGDGTLLGIGGKPHTDRVVETLGTVLAAEVGEELNIDAEEVARNLVIPAREDAYEQMANMAQEGGDRYSLLNEAMKEGLIRMRPRLLGVTLMYVMDVNGSVGRILYVVNSYQEGNTPPTGSYSHDAIQGVLVDVPISDVRDTVPNLGPELAGEIGSASREILMQAISGEGWFTRMVWVDPNGAMHPWGERMKLIPFGK